MNKVAGFLLAAASLVFFGYWMSSFQVKEGCEFSVVWSGIFGFVCLLCSIAIWWIVIHDRRIDRQEREKVVLGHLAQFAFEQALFAVVSSYAKRKAYGDDWNRNTKTLAGLVALLYTQEGYPRSDEVTEQLGSVLGKLRWNLENSNLDVAFLPEKIDGSLTGRLTIILSGGSTILTEIRTPVTLK